MMTNLFQDFKVFMSVGQVRGHVYASKIHNYFFYGKNMLKEQNDVTEVFIPIIPIPNT